MNAGVNLTAAMAGMMQWRAHAYSVVIDQRLDIRGLATLTEAEADEADESGQLAGNHSARIPEAAAGMTCRAPSTSSASSWLDCRVHRIRGRGGAARRGTLGLFRAE